MSSPLELDTSPVQASLNTRRSRLSIVATLRKTSRIFHRGTATATTTTAANAADGTPQPVQPKSDKSRPRWFNSAGARLQRDDRAVAESPESSQDAQVELHETIATPGSPSSPETLQSQSHSPARRRLFGSSRFSLHGLPSRFRRRRAALFSRSSSLSDDDKENFVELAVPAPRSANVSQTGSWSSFRSGVQRAVREMVDGKFRFSDDRGVPLAPPQPPARAPLRTLWPIASAGSSEDQTDDDPTPTISEPPKPHQLASRTWSPDWSPPASPTRDPASPSGSSETSGSGLTHSGSTADSLSVRSPLSDRSSQGGYVEVARSPVDGGNGDNDENLLEVFGESEAGYETEQEGVQERSAEDGVPRMMAHTTAARPVMAVHL